MDGLKLERDRLAGVIRRCLFCKEPRAAERLEAVQYQGHEAALPIEILACAKCLEVARS